MFAVYSFMLQLPVSVVLQHLTALPVASPLTQHDCSKGVCMTHSCDAKQGEEKLFYSNMSGQIHLEQKSMMRGKQNYPPLIHTRLY